MRMKLIAGTALAAALWVAGPVSAGTAEKTVPFAFDQWVDLASTDGPVTLHRLRIVHEGGITKSSFMRPGNSQYLGDIQIQLEFSNEATRDWKARFSIEWVDAEGRAIDGYQGKEGLDSEKHHDQQTVTLSTLKYGLERAKQLKIRIDYDPD